MKKRIITVIAIIACAALCAAVWPRSAEVGDLPAKPVKPTVNAEIEARSVRKRRVLKLCVTSPGRVVCTTRPP